MPHSANQALAAKTREWENIMKNNKLLRAAVAATVVTTGVATVGAVQLVTAGSASARCINVGSGVTTNVTYNGVVVAWETAKPGTCNDDGLYEGSFHLAPNYVGGLYKQNGGTWELMTRSVGDFGWSASTHRSYEEFCFRSVSSAQAICGTGDGMLAIVPSGCQIVCASELPAGPVLLNQGF